MMEDIDQVVQPRVFVHVHQIFPHHAGTGARMCLSYLQRPALLERFVDQN